jgi:hypothetical protein
VHALANRSQCHDTRQATERISGHLWGSLSKPLGFLQQLVGGVVWQKLTNYWRQIQDKPDHPML